jgi:hypothetical protein
MAKQTVKRSQAGGVNVLDPKTKAILDFMARAEKKTSRQFLDDLVWEYFNKNYSNKASTKESSRRKPGRKPGVRKLKTNQGVEKADAPKET